MLLASIKLKSKDKVEFCSGIFLNIFTLITLLYIPYAYFNDGQFNKYEIFYIVLNSVTLVNSYLLIADTNYFKKHIGTIDWYKNRLQIRFTMGENPVVITAFTVVMVLAIVFFIYSTAMTLNRLKNGEWEFNNGLMLYYPSIVMVNIYILISYGYFGRKVVLQKEILEIDDVVELTKEEKESYKHNVVSVIRQDGFINREKLSDIFLRMEKLNKANRIKNSGEYNELLNKYK